MEADAKAVEAFLAAAEQHREEFLARPESTSDTPWPYVLLEWSPEETAPEAVRRVHAVVRENTARLKQIVSNDGWPGRSRVGMDGADAAWLILQHAGSGVASLGTPDNIEFQKQCVPLLRQAVDSGDAHPRHPAHVEDNLCERAGRPPKYGVLASAFAMEHGRAVFTYPSEVPDIDQRRAAIGLPPVDDDARRRSRGQSLQAAGSERAEPWPPESSRTP